MEQTAVSARYGRSISFQPRLLMGALVLAMSCGDSGPGAVSDAGMGDSTGSTAIRQVLVTEKVVVNGAARILEGQLAFGQHDAEFFADDDGIVDNAVLLGFQEIRIVFDELLRFNRLQEFACADGSWSRIPDDTTDADLDNCIDSAILLQSCTNICLDPDTDIPIGILDQDGDGVPDELRLLDYNPDPTVAEFGVSILCDGTSVPLDPYYSYFSSEGSQTFPSSDIGFRGLGPVLVLKPMVQIGLRSGANCTIVFRDEVVNFAGDRVCAPTNGIPTASCIPGDTSKISFATEPLTLVNSAPADGATDVALDTSSFIIVAFNGNIDPDSTGITLTADGAPVAIAPQFSSDDRTVVIIDLGQDYLPGTLYELTAGVGLTDFLGGPVVERSISWTTIVP